MSSVAPVPLGRQVSRTQLRLLEALSAQHVIFSVTEACPLRCRHCIVATVPASVTARTLPEELAKAYADQLDELARRGVRFVSFTGGEPLLAIKQVITLSSAAVAAGMECGIVTACHWARTDKAARETVETLSCIQHWQLSTDVFHEEYLPADAVIRAAHACLAQNREATVRMAAAQPFTSQMEGLYSKLRNSLPPEVGIIVQPLTRMGRARDLESAHPSAAEPTWSCIPTGMLIRFDGTVSPCCSSLADERDKHPFQYPSAAEVGLAAVHRAWGDDALLQLIRAVGFGPVLGWVREMFPAHPVLEDMTAHPCECCIRLWEEPGVGAALRRRAELPENRRKIAALTRTVLGESSMEFSASDAREVS